MSILFAGTEMGAVVPANSDTIESTTASVFDSGFCRAALKVNHFLSYGETPNFGAQTGDVFIHGECVISNFGSGTTRHLLVCLNNAGTQVFRVNCVSGSVTSSVLQMQWSADGISWTNIGSTVSYSGGTRTTFDLYINPDATGSASLYMAGTQRATGTANLSTMTDIAQVRFTSCDQLYWSQMIVADESTIGWRLKTVPATGAGNSTTWIGTFAEIDEAVYSDADFINSAAANEIELFSHSSTVPDGYRVKAVVVTARAKRGASGPQNLQLALRSGGTNYFSSSQALDVGYGAFLNVWEDDPATSAAFTASAIAALQFGVKSIA